MQTQPQLTQAASPTEQGTPASVEGEVAGQVREGPRILGSEGIVSRNPLLARLPVEVDVAVPIRKFRVRNLLALAQGQIIESQWLQGEDLPLSAPGTQLAWIEFEVIDTRLVVRITRLV